MPLYDMKLEDLRRELLKFRFDPAYHGADNRVPLNSFAHFCGVSRQTLYALMARHQAFDLKPGTRSSIVHGVWLVLHGMRWKRRGRVWSPEMPDGKPPKLMPRQGADDGVAHV